MFVDRREASQKLAEKVLSDPFLKTVGKHDLLVLSIPRGGVIVGTAIARALGCAHDVIVVKKIGFPGREELAIGAVAEDGAAILNEQMFPYYREQANYVPQAIERVKGKISALIKQFRGGRPLNLQSKVVILVDDGIATGETMKAAVKWATSPNRQDQPKTVIVAIPVCSPQAARELSDLVDNFIYVAAPEHFWAIGQFYGNFNQISEDEVKTVLRNSTPSPA